MESDSTKSKKECAYFRALDQTHQCELSFLLKISLKEVGIIEQEINAVRQITDTVSSLLQHIHNKINKLISTKSNTEQNCVKEPHLLSYIHIALKVNDEDVPGDTVCQALFTENTKTVQFEIFEQKYNVIVNAPLVQAIHLPVIIYANFEIQPTRCKTLYTDRTLSECKWYRSKDCIEWSEIGQKFSYKTKQHDLDHFLKFQFIPRNKSSEGPVYEVVSENKVQQIPKAPRCPFEERHEHIKSKLTGKEYEKLCMFY